MQIAQSGGLSHVVQRLHTATPIVPDVAVEDGRGDAPPSLAGTLEGAAASAMARTEQALPVMGSVSCPELEGGDRKRAQDHFEQNLFEVLITQTHNIHKTFIYL